MVGQSRKSDDRLKKSFSPKQFSFHAAHAWGENESK